MRGTATNSLAYRSQTIGIRGVSPICGSVGEIIKLYPAPQASKIASTIGPFTTVVPRMTGLVDAISDCPRAFLWNMNLAS